MWRRPLARIAVSRCSIDRGLPVLCRTRLFCTNEENKNTKERLHMENTNADEERQNQEKTVGEPGELGPRGKIITRTIGIVLLSGVAWFVADMIKQNLPHDKPADVKIKTEGEIDIGKPFLLTDHNGKPCDSVKDFGGKFMLIYFGFTYCPDICPTELTKIAQVMDKLEEIDKAAYVQPIMITVDPYRDSVEQIHSYVTEFHPKLIGLTGTSEEIKKVAKDYKIYNVVPEKAGQEDYLVDHSVFTFLMGPNGGFLDFFGPDKTEEEMKERILERISDLEDERNPPSFWTRCERKVKSWKKTFSSMLAL